MVRERLRDEERMVTRLICEGSWRLGLVGCWVWNSRCRRWFQAKEEEGLTGYWTKNKRK